MLVFSMTGQNDSSDFVDSVHKLNSSRPAVHKLRVVKVKRMCNTGWVECHTSLEEFEEMYEAIQDIDRTGTARALQNHCGHQ